MSVTTWAGAYAATATPTQHRIVRTDDLDLLFDGWRVGASSQTVNSYTTIVEIYVTASGRIVTTIERRAPAGQPRRTAAVHETPGDALHWLATDNRGRLGHVSKTAWLRACEVVPPLRSYMVQVVP